MFKYNGFKFIYNKFIFYLFLKKIDNLYFVYLILILYLFFINNYNNNLKKIPYTKYISLFNKYYIIYRYVKFKILTNSKYENLFNDIFKFFE